MIRGSNEYIGYTKPSVHHIPGGPWSCSSAISNLGSPAPLSDSFLRNLQMMFDFTFSGGLPTGPVMRITALYDAGSDMLTCYIRDLRHLDPSHRLLALLSPYSLQQASFTAELQQARLACCMPTVKEWFMENFSIQPTARNSTCMAYQSLMLLETFEDTRLTGAAPVPPPIRDGRHRQVTTPAEPFLIAYSVLY